jgi:hypothetical protein
MSRQTRIYWGTASISVETLFVAVQYLRTHHSEAVTKYQMHNIYHLSTLLRPHPDFTALSVPALIAVYRAFDGSDYEKACAIVAATRGMLPSFEEDQGPAQQVLTSLLMDKISLPMLLTLHDTSAEPSWMISLDSTLVPLASFTTIPITSQPNISLAVPGGQTIQTNATAAIIGSITSVESLPLGEINPFTTSLSTASLADADTDPSIWPYLPGRVKLAVSTQVDGYKELVGLGPPCLIEDQVAIIVQGTEASFVILRSDFMATAKIIGTMSLVHDGKLVDFMDISSFVSQTHDIKLV